MAEGGKILAGIIKEVSVAAKEGVSLLELDELAFKLTKAAGAEPAFLGYRPEGATRAYPATICASLNEVVVHGVPDKRVLKSGDVLKLDFGLFYKGFCTDSAVTIAIGEISREALKLIKITRESLEAAIREVQIGKTLGDIGFAVESSAVKNGFKPVRGLTGHGIGERLHEDPVVYNFGKRGSGLQITPGLVIAIEPMISAGSDRIKMLNDEGYATIDGSLSAHFEHTVAVTKDGTKVLTTI